MEARPRWSLFFLSAIALFVELALIRWLGAEVRIYAYFKNLILIACFLGFGVGFYHSARRARLGLSVLLLVVIIAFVAIPARLGSAWGPQSASSALSNFYGSIFMGDVPTHDAVPATTLIVGLSWTFAVFAASLFTIFGYAQRIGAGVGAFGPSRRLEAYSWNVAGSMAGVLSFFVVSYLSMPPLVWFVAVLAATLPFLSRWRTRVLTTVGLIFVLVVLFPDEQATWSPYQKLEVREQPQREFKILVNGTGYMTLHSFDRPAGAGIDRWTLPYFAKPDAQKVLIVGAGGGNDAAAALRSNAQEIVAVEIDPQVYEIGRRLHPDSPYSDPRVREVIDDARHYVETTDERFDLIVMSHLDSHTALSGYTNLRLDNYIYTLESLRVCRRILKPGGLLYLSFWATQPWVATRLQENLDEAFDRPPWTLFVRDERGIIHAHYIAGEFSEPANWSVPDGNWAPGASAPPPFLTDDWPYLFVEKRRIPTPMLILAIPLALLVTLVLLATLRRKESRESDRRLDRHFFFLGAGFLIVEVHNVSKLARVFGTTWTVNAWVITGILLVILLANFLARRWPRLTSGRWIYALLIASLVAAAFARIESILSLPLGSAMVVLCYASPLLFAGLIFANSFRTFADAPRALGSNILGSVLGGFLELSSFVIGLSNLLIVAVIFYLLSFPLASQKTAAG